MPTRRRSRSATTASASSAPVYFGDTVTVEYKISAIDTGKRRSTGDITIKNQDGTLVAVGQHILKWVKNK